MTQLSLPSVSLDGVSFRPIHYLGSKLRLIPAIRSVLNRVAPTGPLCDLFAGSGTVSIAMADTRPVVSVDIQEYSRLICSASLAPPPNILSLGVALRSSAQESTLLSRLRNALKPLLEYEDRCIAAAITGDPDALCDFVEHGSLTLFDDGAASHAHQDLKHALELSLTRLIDDNLARSVEALVTRQFGGAYFSFRQAIELDALLETAHTLPSALRDAGVALVLSTASEIVNTVGKHFAQPIRPRDNKGVPKRQLVKRIISDRNIDVFDAHRVVTQRYARLPRTLGPHHTIRDDFASFLAQKSCDVAVFYADPPYTRDHYSRFYHVLETMALRDKPEVSRTMIHTDSAPRISRGFYRADRHQSPFCIKSQAANAFAKLFDGVHRFGVPLVLSYSPFDDKSRARPRLMSIERIEELARERFRRVEVASAGRFAHSKLNVQDRNAPTSWAAEIFIVCLP